MHVLGDLAIQVPGIRFRGCRPHIGARTNIRAYQVCRDGPMFKPQPSLEKSHREGKAARQELLREALKPLEAIRMQEVEKVAEQEVSELERVSLGTTPEARRRSKRRLKTMIIGFGVILVIIGIALAAYVATYENEPVLIALGPAYIGVIVIIAAMRGKKL